MIRHKTFLSPCRYIKTAPASTRVLRYSSDIRCNANFCCIFLLFQFVVNWSVTWIYLYIKLCWEFVRILQRIHITNSSQLTLSAVIHEVRLHGYISTVESVKRMFLIISARQMSLIPQVVCAALVLRGILIKNTLFTYSFTIIFIANLVLIYQYFYDNQKENRRLTSK